MKYNKYTFFFKGKLSQWNMTKFKVRGKVFNCSEQFMMAMKALLFKDKETYKKIMNSGSPKEQKALGRQVKNFNKDKWNKYAKQFVYIGNYARFKQNSELKQLLLETKRTLLVEASPYDRIWGIGMSIDNPLKENPKNWNGTNWLGEVLTKVRDDIIKEEYID